MLTDPKLCSGRQRLAKLGLKLIVSRPEGRVRLDDSGGRGAENLLQISHLGITGSLGGTQGGTQGGGVGDGQTKDRSTKNICENLGHGRILGGTAR